MLKKWQQVEVEVKKVLGTFGICQLRDFGTFTEEDSGVNKKDGESNWNSVRGATWNNRILK